MKKTELIAAVAEKSGISKKDAEKAVTAVIDTIIDKSMFLLTDDSGIAADSTERQGN